MGGQVFVRDHGVDVGEITSAEVFDLLQHAIRPAACAIGGGHCGGHRAHGCFIGGERALGNTQRKHLCANDPGIDNRLARPIGANRVGGVRGIPHQGDRTVLPGGQRIAINHRIFIHDLGPPDQSRDVDPVELPFGKIREEIGDICRAVPAFTVPGRGGVELFFCDPVDRGDLHRPAG